MGMTAALVAMMATGCIFLDADRRTNFLGPSWDVPFVVPLFAKQTQHIVDVFEFEIDPDGTLGFTRMLDRVEFDVPPGWQAPNFTLEPQVMEVDVGDLADADSFGFVDVVLSLHIVNDAGFGGTLKLKIDGMSDGEVDESKTANIPLGQSDPLRLNLTNVLNAKPDKLRLTWVAALQAGASPVAGGKFAVAPEVWVPLVLDIGPDGQQFPLGDAIALDLSEDARTTIRNAPITDVAIVMDVETRLPFGIQLDVAFGSDPDEGTLTMFVPAAPTDEFGRAVLVATHTVELVVGERVRSAMVADGARAEATLTLFGSGASQRIRLTRDDFLAFKAYATITAVVNDGGERQ